jgi:hypothetical protein
MQEITPPVQKNFFAVGKEYWMKIVIDQPATKVVYIAPFRLTNGRIDHIFAHQVDTDKVSFASCSVWSDAAVRLFIGEEA